MKLDLQLTGRVVTHGNDDAVGSSITTPPNTGPSMEKNVLDEFESTMNLIIAACVIIILTFHRIIFHCWYIPIISLSLILILVDQICYIKIISIRIRISVRISILWLLLGLLIEIVIIEYLMSTIMSITINIYVKI